MHPNDSSGTIYNSQDTDDGWMNKEDMVHTYRDIYYIYIHNGVSLNHIKMN